MLRVAFAVVLLTLVGLVPAQASSHLDECKGATASKPCVAVDANALPTTVKAGKYYVWGAAYQCAPSFSADCSGRPAERGTVGGVAVPVAGLMGVVYQETNNLEGLQRFQTYLGKTYPPDVMLLV